MEPQGTTKKNELQTTQKLSSDFWYNFDNKRFTIKKKKIWAHNRKPPQSAGPLIPIREPVRFVYLSFGVTYPGSRSKLASYWDSRLGTNPGSLMVMNVMRHLQAGEFKKNKPDIRYNFMIGGDGVVYEGRGLRNRPALPKKYWYNQNDSFFIGFIGRWINAPPPRKLIELKDEVIKYAIEQHSIKRKHCQIAMAYPCKYAHELPKHL